MRTLPLGVDRRGIYRRSLVLLAALAAATFAGSAHADDVADESDILFTVGGEAYQKGDFKGALEHFLASNRLVKNRNVLFNIARSYEQLKQFPEAHRYYTRALEGEMDEPTISRVKEAILRISSHVALLRIVTEPPGAHVYLNRKDLGERGNTPQSTALPPGRYRVIVDLPGWDDASQDDVDVRIGSEKVVSLTLRQIVGKIRVPGPPGALVRLDSDDAPPACQAAPCVVTAPPGQHTVIVEKVGFRTLRQTVAVEANKEVMVKPQLVAETGTLVVNADERDASIEVDGTTQGFTPAVVTTAVGTHRVRVTLRGFRPVEREVTVEANRQARLDLRLVNADSVEAASRVEESVDDAPASVSLISGQELRAMHYPTLAEALRGTRGIYISDDRGYSAIGVRGFGRPGAYGNRVLITVDGTPVNDDWIWASYVGFDQRTDLDDIDRIEVVRGPGSVLYGTSAFSGVVNLISRGRDVPAGREVGVSTTTDGTLRARARVAEHFGPDAGVWMSVAAGKSAGRDFFVPEYVADGPADVAGNSRGLDRASFGTVTGLAWWRSLSLKWSLNHHGKHLPIGQFDTTFGDGRAVQYDTRGFVEARFEPKLGDQLSSLTRVTGNLYTYRAYLPRSVPNGGLERDTYDSPWAGAEQRFIWNPVPQIRLNVGGEVQEHPSARQTVATEIGGSELDDRQSFQIAAVYVNADVRVAKPVKVSAGARLDYYSTFGSSINPRFAVVLKPYEAGNVKVLAGKAFKAPSLYELYYKSGGDLQNPNLESENTYLGELEYSHRFSESVVGTLSGYANYITNLIVLSEVLSPINGAGVNQYQNTKTPVGTLGGEGELRREWKEGWMVGGSYAFQRTVYLADTLGDLFTLSRSPDRREVPNSPAHLASIKGAVPILSRALTLATRLTFASGRYDRNDRLTDPAQQKTDDQFLWDVMFTGTESRWGLTYAFGVYNAFDSRAVVPVSTEFRQTTVPIAGRSLNASASVAF